MTSNINVQGHMMCTHDAKSPSVPLKKDYLYLKSISCPSSIPPVKNALTAKKPFIISDVLIKRGEIMT